MENQDDKYEHLNYEEFGGKGGKHRAKGGAGAGSGKIAAKGDASKGAVSSIVAGEEKRKVEAKK